MNSNEVTPFTVFNTPESKKIWLYPRECPECFKEMDYQEFNQKFVCNNVECSNYDNPEKAEISTEYEETYIQ